MRLSFPNGEHADVALDAGALSLGGAEGNTVRLSAEGVAPWHARISFDQRGGVLEVLDPAARTHVNARPVREKALLRLGDVVSLGPVAVALKPDGDDAVDTRIPEPSERRADLSRPVAARVVLRGVSGAWFGKAVSVGDRLVIGHGGDSGLVLDEPQMGERHAAVENLGDSLCLRDLGSADGTWVNGVRVRNAVLHTGDQIAFERNRFVVEAPGLPQRGRPHIRTPSMETPAVNTQTLPVLKPASADGATAGRNGMWWLIGAAAVIGLCLAALLLFGA